MRLPSLAGVVPALEKAVFLLLHTPPHSAQRTEKQNASRVETSSSSPATISLNAVHLLLCAFHSVSITVKYVKIYGTGATLHKSSPSVIAFCTKGANQNCAYFTKPLRNVLYGNVRSGQTTPALSARSGGRDVGKDQCTASAHRARRCPVFDRYLSCAFLRCEC